MSESATRRKVAFESNKFSEVLTCAFCATAKGAGGGGGGRGQFDSTLFKPFFRTFGAIEPCCVVGRFGSTEFGVLESASVSSFCYEAIRGLLQSVIESPCVFARQRVALHVTLSLKRSC